MCIRDSHFKDYICIIVLVLLGIALRFARESLSHVVKWTIIVLFGIIQLIVDYKISYITLWISICSGVTCSAITYLLLYCPTWDDFFNRLEKIIGKAD